MFSIKHIFFFSVVAVALFQLVKVTFNDIKNEQNIKDKDKDKDKDKENKQSSEEETENNKDEDDVADESIESIPFISEPVKKKRTRSSK